MNAAVLKRIIQLSCLFAVILASCSPSYPDYVSDYDVVYTNQDKAYNFSGINTYFMPDSVVHITEGGTADHRYDRQILSSLKSNLDALGWTQLSETGQAKADVVVMAAASDQTWASCAYYCWYCYWGWYPGWGYYPPAWGPGYGWGYPTDIVCTSYSTGSVIVSIADPNLVSDADTTLPVKWMGILNGLLQGTDAEINQRIDKNIDQMFIQSPYLKQ
ncbi:DUF4136 domain-containing protein [Flavihumibacter solisilvae]|jgi:hypothetical protein|uniref:DUF4136 domain-containing protein n=1 Tax=Flavihumibacter solisilvae TaxID=1349421 RepID=UPI00068F67AE|nr:DUF4136 domain-containing protein [Flavihumibacter solisilvae]